MSGDIPFPIALLVSSAIAALPVVYWAVIGSNWSALRNSTPAQHFFWASVLIVSVVWSMTAGVQPGLQFHLLLYTALVLVMGIRLAMIAVLLVHLVMVIVGAISWTHLGYEYFFQAIIPLGFTYLVFLLINARMAHNPFIYIFLCGFFNAGFTQGLTDFIQAGMLWLTDVYEWKVIWRDFGRYILFIMFPEGFITGMFIAGMVAFNPRWLSTFDEDSYFH